MDTEHLFLAEWFDTELLIADLLTEDIDSLKSYIELARKVQENQQLFGVFNFNFNVLLQCYRLYASDEVEKLADCPNGFDDFTALNALTISIISSAKTLIESIQTEDSCYKYSYCDDVKKKAKEIYDAEPSYRLLIRLRDFAQHGHLPVSIQENRVCFDIPQILQTPQFNHNKTVKNEFERISDSFSGTNGQLFHYTYTYAMSLFITKVLEVYLCYLNCIEADLERLYETCQSIILEHKDSINNTLIPGKSILLYCEDGGNAHGFDTNESPLQMLEIFKQEVDDVYQNEMKAYNDLKQAFKKI